jgi:hypothetical protein
MKHDFNAKGYSRKAQPQFPSSDLYMLLVNLNQVKTIQGFQSATIVENRFGH